MTTGFLPSGDKFRLLLFKRIVPFRNPLIAVVVSVGTAIVATVGLSVIVLLCSRRGAVPPVTGTVDPISLAKGSTVAILLDTRLTLRPSTVVEAMPPRTFRIFAVLVPRLLIESTVAAVSAVSIAALSSMFPILTRCEALQRSTHTALKVLGAFMPKTLAGLHRTPPFAVLIIVVTSSAEGTVLIFPIPVAFENIRVCFVATHPVGPLLTVMTVWVF
jgi:hypothetical protein